MRRSSSEAKDAFAPSLNPKLSRKLCPGLCERAYVAVAAKCEALEELSAFNHFITLAILVASVMVGLGTEDSFASMQLMGVAEDVVLGIFVLECAVKIVARRWRPLDYFRDNWNLFDFAIVVASVVPLFLPLDDFTDIVAVFRLLRLLRIFKLAKQLQQLKIIVEALIKGFSSITFIALILFIFFYVFAIVGMLIFKGNDPHHFGTLHIAMLTLFRSATMDDWTDLMYINMLGCDEYGYPALDNHRNECTAPRAYGYVSVLYFVTFQVLGALILLSLFIGVVTTAMDEAEQQAKQDEVLSGQVKEIRRELGMTEEDIYVIERLFKRIDVDREGTISLDELAHLFAVLQHMAGDLEVTPETVPSKSEGQAANNAPTLGQAPTGVQAPRVVSGFEALFNAVDDDESGVLEFPEFLYLLLRVHRGLLKSADGKLRGKQRAQHKAPGSEGSSEGSSEGGPALPGGFLIGGFLTEDIPSHLDFSAAVNEGVDAALLLGESSAHLPAATRDNANGDNANGQGRVERKSFAPEADTLDSIHEKGGQQVDDMTPLEGFIGDDSSNAHERLQASSVSTDGDAEVEALLRAKVVGAAERVAVLREGKRLLLEEAKADTGEGAWGDFCALEGELAAIEASALSPTPVSGVQGFC